MSIDHDGASHQRSLVRIMHTSDLHLGGGAHDGDLPLIDRLLRAAADSADVLVLAGDVFDHNAVPDRLLAQVCDRFAAAAPRIVILPGNHDCLTAGGAFDRAAFHRLPNVDVIGLSAHETVLIPEFDLEIWGRPHREYEDFSPLARMNGRTHRWRVAVAHGHWVGTRPVRRCSWQITADSLDAVDSDYVALGHWDVPTEVRGQSVTAHYSGSPRSSGGVNLLKLDGAASPAIIVDRLSV